MSEPLCIPASVEHDYVGDVCRRCEHRRAPDRCLNYVFTDVAPEMLLRPMRPVNPNRRIKRWRAR